MNINIEWSTSSKREPLSLFDENLAYDAAIKAAGGDQALLDAWKAMKSTNDDSVGHPPQWNRWLAIEYEAIKAGAHDWAELPQTIGISNIWVAQNTRIRR